jgi:hypothetical protein
MTDNEAKGRFTDTGFIAGTTPDTPPAKATQPPGTLPILGGHASSNSAAIDLLRRIREWDHLPLTGDGPYWMREIDKVLADAIPNSVAEPEVQRGRDESLIPTFDGWDDEPGHTSPNSVSITVSEEAADWITAKAMEHGCTEDDVIAKLIAEWDHPQ